jgi:hypothetical protein
MKKRLSNNYWQQIPVSLSILVIFAILGFSFRCLSLTWDFGVIRADIPVVRSPFVDPLSDATNAREYDVIDHKTPAVVLTTDGFFFGEVKAFTEDLAEVRNKYKVTHDNGRPRLDKLWQDYQKWQGDLAKKNGYRDSKVILFATEGSIPAPIVIQVVAGLRQMTGNKKIVIATGIF